jgi:hypothetical protein
MRRTLLFALAGITLVSTPGVSPALAAGFFESIFGPPPMQAAPPPPPVYQVYPSRAFRPTEGLRMVRKVHPAPHLRKMMVALRDMSVKDTPSQRVAGQCCASVGDAMSAISRDTTLKAGDLVMTQRGLTKFVGSSGGFHRARDFVAVRTTSDGSPDLDNFARLNTPDPAGVGVRGLTIFAGESRKETLGFRSLDESVPMRVVDPRGRSLRFVGGSSLPANLSIWNGD